MCNSRLEEDDGCSFVVVSVVFVQEVETDWQRGVYLMMLLLTMEYTWVMLTVSMVLLLIITYNLECQDSSQDIRLFDLINGRTS